MISLADLTLTHPFPSELPPALLAEPPMPPQPFP